MVEIQKMDRTHVIPVADIHYSSWNDSEISVRLGERYLKKFYLSVVDSEHSFGFISAVDNEVIGYATGYYDYIKFNQYFSQKYFFDLIKIVLSRLVLFRIDIFDIINLLQDSKKTKNIKYPKYHLGALALDNRYKNTAKGREGITGVIGAVHDELKYYGFPGCWGVCDFENVPMKKYLIKLGYSVSKEVKYYKKKIIVFEKQLI